MAQKHSNIVDIETFNRLFVTYKQRFINFAVSYVNDVAVGEDIVMDCFTSSWERRDRLTSEEFVPYTLTSIKNRCLNHLRNEKLHSEVADNLRNVQMRTLDTKISTLDACNPMELFSTEARQLVDRAVDALPARTRDVFIRSRFNGESYKQIAEQLQITPKSVEFELSKATRSLRLALKDYLLALWVAISLFV